MRKKLIAGGSLLVVVLAAGYVFRGPIRDAWSAWTAPKLPEAVKYVPEPLGTGLTEGDAGVVEGGVSTSENYAIVTAPPPQPKAKDPLENRGPLPTEANLAIPFMTQAPFANWEYPYQEACEEASAIMVDAFYDGETGRISDEVAKARIDTLVEYENKELGFYKDTTAEETAEFLREYFGYRNVVILPVNSADEIRRVVANGYPVILPASGKLLENPNFRNGGPLYHMFVVKGYTDDKRFITNDPGTRNGANFLYTEENLMESIHDWNGGDVLNGKRVMIVVLPN
jgi:hypothetical protein